MPHFFKSVGYFLSFFVSLIVASSCAANIALPLLSHYYRCTSVLFFQCVSEHLSGILPLAGTANLLAGPSLYFVYLPLSMWFWANRRSQWWKLVLIVIFATALNGFAFARVVLWDSVSNRHNIEDLINIVVLFAGTGFLSAIFHYWLLRVLEKIRFIE
ncbi:MAG: hypothetical protein JWO78_1377 [Micavibrio sp.]|nr:hypothetical protein [Micavibrio sp.]